MLDVVGGDVVAAIETSLPLLRVRVLRLPKKSPGPSTGLRRASASDPAPVLHHHECWALSETVSSRSKMLQTLLLLLLRRGCRNGDAQGEESSDGWAPPLTSPTRSFAIERNEKSECDARFGGVRAAPALSFSRTMIDDSACISSSQSLPLLLCPRVPRGGV